MNDPVKDIPSVIERLTQGSPKVQAAAIEEYFVPDASFTHPFCAVPAFAQLPVPGLGAVNSRWVILAIYRWYKFLSPRIDLAVDSCAFDQENRILYVSAHQTFALWFVPLYKARVRLVTVLRLEERLVRDDPTYAQALTDGAGDEHPRLLIASQEDHYQVNEFVKFALPGLGPLVVGLLWLYASFLCVLGALVTGSLGVRRQN